MKKSLLLPIYALTLFVSAFLIFSVQPLFSKMILPLLGGSSSVWNTAMVFFQAMLLAGYAYAHFSSTYLSFRYQVTLHLILLAICSVFLPFAVQAGGEEAFANPVLWQLSLMLVAIGGPFFVLSASAPLIQKWFAASQHQRSANPYFLYAVSNIGSMGSLLAYPLLVEPLTTLSQQRLFWAVGYGVLIILSAACGIFVWYSKERSEEIIAKPTKPTLLLKLKWILYSFIPSSLMLGFTTLITTDLASVPLFWVLPLAIYLLTFIIAFAEKPPITADQLAKPLMYILILMAFLLMSGGDFPRNFLVVFYLLSFFVCAQYCHSQLANMRPPTAYLTNYYLSTSFGGVLGGIFNALLAPLIFVIPAELSCALILNALVLIKDSDRSLLPKRVNFKYFLILVTPICMIATLIWADPAIRLLMGFFMLLVMLINIRYPILLVWTIIVMLIVFPPVGWNLNQNVLLRERNYFGSLSIRETSVLNTFWHGVTVHGAQPKAQEYHLVPVTYYHPMGPIGDVFQIIDRRPLPQQIAVLGLGVGSVACYRLPDRVFDFYEIDPAVIRIAEDPNYFTYLANCGSTYRTILGDARLEILEAKDRQYDLIFVDTFSSDNIPVHVMTREAFQSYFQKLKPEGMIAMNISNRYLDLRPVLSSIAKELGVEIRLKIDRRSSVIDTKIPYYNSIYAVMTKSKERIAEVDRLRGWKSYQGDLPAVWTDDYVNIIGAFGAVQ